jgi:hypothetical protein
MKSALYATKLGSSLVLVVSLFTGCALDSVTMRKANPAFVNSESNLQANIKAQDVANDLTRYGSIDYARNVRVTPFTEPYLRAIAEDTGAKKLSSKQEIEADFQKAKSLYIGNKTCFFISIDTLGRIEGAKFVHWTAKFQDTDGQLYPVTFDRLTGVGSVPRIASLNRWENSTTGCASKYFDLTKPVKLIIIPPTFETGPNLPLSWGIDPEKK